MIHDLPEAHLASPGISAAPSLPELVEQRSLVRVLVGRLTSDPTEADDIEQQVWLSVLQSPPAHGGAIKSWFAQVVRNTTCSWFDRKRRQQQREALSADLRSHEDQFELTEFEGPRHALETALDRLSPLHSEVLRMRYYEGMLPSEIARELGVAIETIYTRQKRALKQLRDCLRVDPRKDRGYSGLVAFFAKRWGPGLAWTGALAGCVLLSFLIGSALSKSDVQSASPQVAGLFALDAPSDSAQIAELPSPNSGLALLAERSRSELSQDKLTAPGLSSLRVLLLDQATGSPRSGTGVALRQLGSGSSETVHSQLTDMHGRVAFEELTHGAWSVVTQPGTRQDVRLLEGESRDLTIELPMGITVVGMVFDNTSKSAPVAGASISTMQPGSVHLFPALATTGAGGSFVLRGIQPEAFVYASKPGYLISTGVYIAGTSSGTPSDVLLRLRKSSPAYGLVHDEQGNPVQGAKVRPIEGSPNLQRDNLGQMVLRLRDSEMSTDHMGVVQLGEIPVGETDLEVSHPDYETMRVSVRLTQESMDVRDGGAPLRIALKDRVSSFPGRLLSRRVICLDAQGQRLPFAQVTYCLARLAPEGPYSYLAPANGLFQSARASEQGELQLEGLGEEPYRLWLLSDDGSTPLAVLDSLPGEVDHPETLTVSNSSTARGRIFGELEFARQLVLSSTSLPQALTVPVDPVSGDFHMHGLLSGKYTIYLNQGAWGMKPLHEFELHTGKEVHLGMLEVPHRARIEYITDLLPTQGGNTPRGHAILKPAQGMAIFAIPGMPREIARFGLDGMTEFKQVPPGQYVLSIAVPGTRRISVPIDLRPGQFYRASRVGHSPDTLR